jgi:hypothetical protein
VTGVPVPRPSASRAARAAAFIQEEAATREQEKTILAELLSLKSGKHMMLETMERRTHSEGLRKRLENRIAATKVSAAEVERDSISGIELTYLEMFVLEDLIEQSIQKAKSSKRQLESAAIVENINLVDRLEFDQPIAKVLRSPHPEWHTADPDSGLKTVFLPTEFAEMLLLRRVIELHWLDSGNGDRESTLQSHAEAVFPEDIRYTPLQKVPAGASKTAGSMQAVGAAAPEGELFSGRILRADIGPVLVPAPASQPTPGRFYRITSGDGLFEITKKAYGTGSMQSARLINESGYNRRFWKPAPASEQEMFPDGRISFSPRFNGDLRVQMESSAAVSSGHSFAMIWIPPQDGGEPF